MKTFKELKALFMQDPVRTAKENPKWVADNFPEWMGDNRQEWMIKHRPKWMKECQPVWEARNNHEYAAPYKRIKTDKTEREE